MDFHRQYGTKVKIVRIFNTYGPRMAVGDGRVVSNFITQALRGEDIIIYGDGSQTRSFQYISDLINGFMQMVKTENSFTGPVNLGIQEEHTIKELADCIIALTGSHSNIDYKPLPQDDPIKRKPDNLLSQKIFGYKPIVNIKNGLINTITHFAKEEKTKYRV